MPRGGYRPGAGGQRKEITGKKVLIYLYPKQIEFLESLPKGSMSPLIRNLLDQEQRRVEELERIKNAWRPIE